MTKQMQPLDTTAPPPPSARPKRLFRRIFSIPEMGAFIPLAILSGAFAVLSPAMRSGEEWGGLLRSMQFLAIIVIGQSVLMMVGEFDLSVGSVAGLGSILSAYLMKNAGFSPAHAIGVAMLAGALTGLFNGSVTVLLGIPAFITTLGMFYIARETAYLISPPIYSLSPQLKAFSEAKPLGVSWTFVILLCIALVADLFMRFTTSGRRIYATGGNREVAIVAGINTSRLKITCFIFIGILAALAGSLLAAQYNLGQPEAGLGWELDVIAGTVIGGTSLFGGVGSVAGALLGLLLMFVVRSGLVLVGSGHINDHWQGIAVGLIMIGAVYVDLIRRRAKI